MKRVDSEIEHARTLDPRWPSWLERRWGYHTENQLSRFLGWIGFVAVLTAVCGLENAVASIQLEQAQDAGPSLIVSGAPPIPERLETVPLVITLRDREGGKPTQWQCTSSTDRAPAEAVVVDASALIEVATALCGPT
jgi:hypothetical protein